MIPNLGKLAGKTIFITGASRGIGKAIAEKCARDRANIVIAAKTSTPHPKLPGTIYSAAEDIEKLGGECLPLEVDVRDENQVGKAIKDAVKRFGGIDILVNNASAISLTNTINTEMKKFDLMFGVNVRGTYLCSKYCIPHLKERTNSKILNISPPLNMAPHWFKDHCAYTMAKYGMSMCALGMAEELKPFSISVNAIWPRTAIYTAAMEMLGGGQIINQCRKPEIMSDAAYMILANDDASNTGNFYIDEDVLQKAGIDNMEQYSYVKNPSLLGDLFLDGLAETFSEHHQGGFGKALSSNQLLSDVLETIQTSINSDLVKEMKAIYLFDLKGEGIIMMDLKNGSGKLSHLSELTPEKADVTFTLTTDEFCQIFRKIINPTAAYMTGKLKIQGDLGKAMKLEKLLSSLDT